MRPATTDGRNVARVGANGVPTKLRVLSGHFGLRVDWSRISSN